MNVEIRAEAALFPVKEYTNGIAVAVQSSTGSCCPDVSKCSSDPCDVDTSRWKTGFYGVDVQNISLILLYKKFIISSVDFLVIC
jgi:hypothetical protein